MSAWFPPPEEAAALKEAVRLLRELEWSDWDESDHAALCPVCQTEMHRIKARRTHAPGCRLDAFLKRWGTP